MTRVSDPAPPLTGADLTTALEYFWHPVATEAELDRAGGPMAVRLLGRDLVVARLGPGYLAAVDDRCPHRSTRLSVGSVDGATIRCAYHGWRWAGDGRCVEIPSAPATPIPHRFRQRAYEVVGRHGLVWVRLREGAPSAVPACPARDDPAMRVTDGEPYTWTTSAPRRVENFVDLAHFAWVHDGTLGVRDQPVPPDVTPRREQGELRFEFVPPALPDDPEDAALVGHSIYRLPMPLTVDIEFDLGGPDHHRRHLWMTASPIDPGTCRTFWCVARTDEHDRPDAEYLDFQAVVLAEDEPVVTSQFPPEIPLDPTGELSVKADRISLEYRRWLAELAAAGRDGAPALAAALGAAATPA